MISSSNEKQLKSNGERRRIKVSHRKWTVKEDKALMAALYVLCELGWKRETGSFKCGYTERLEKELTSTLPESNLKATPHIESRLKLLKMQYDAIIEMKDADGMQWNRKEQIVTCLDDDVWDEWLKNYPFAKGLRNKPFPYYYDLRCIFGHRNKQKGLKKAPGSKMQNDDVVDVVEAATAKRQKSMDHGDYENGLDAKDSGGRVNVAESFNEYDDYESKRNILAIPSHVSTITNPEEADDLVGGECPNGLNLPRDTAKESETSIQGGDAPARTDSAGNNSLLSKLEEVRKIFGSFLQKHGEQLSLLMRMLGKEALFEGAATQKRTGLNGELRKLTNLNLHSRLRAATLVVDNAARLDLFYSLPENEREEWVSMLLSGLI